MIEFREKIFTEFDAMRKLYVELSRDFNWKNKVKVIGPETLLPILRGNNIVIERFVISTSFLHPDKYRMYLKIGAKAKMPEKVRLPGFKTTERFGRFSFNYNGKAFSDFCEGTYSYDESKNGILLQKDFADNGGSGNNSNNGGKNNSNNNNGGNNKKDEGGSYGSGQFKPSDVEISRDVTKLLGEVIKYDRKNRSLVLEFESIEYAIKSLDVLPFGINYNLYLLEV